MAAQSMAQDIVDMAQKQYNCSYLHNATAQRVGTWGNKTQLYLYSTQCQRILNFNKDRNCVFEVSKLKIFYIPLLLS